MISSNFMELNYMLYRLLILLFFFISFNKAYSQKNLQTTRLISTGGAGVASLLMHESALLNPASIAFFNSSSFYYEKWSSHLIEKKASRSEPSSDGKGEQFIISDTTSELKGSLLYQQSNENGYKRSRFSSSMASPIGKQTSLGFIYRYTQDKTPNNNIKPYHQGVMGITHIYSPKLSFGATVEDIGKTKKTDTLSTFGAQYQIFDSIIVIGDVGGNYSYAIEKLSYNRLALQFRFFENFYVRGGKFYDRFNQEFGNSYGISLVGPKLTLEYAYKKSEFLKNKTDEFYKGEKYEEMSFSLSIRI